MTWLAIDAVERPDLVLAVADGAILEPICPRCLGKLIRTDPLLVTRLCRVAPLIMALADDGVAHVDRPPAETGDLLDRVHDQLGDQVLAPGLLVPFSVLETAASRDVDLDVENLAGCGAGDAAVVGAAKGESPGYAAFLLDAHRSTAPRRLEECLGRLWLVQTVDELGVSPS